MALSDNPKFPGVGPRRAAFNTRMQNMGQQYNQYAGLTNSAVDYAMMQENVELYGEQGARANTYISNLEIEAQHTLQNTFNAWYKSGDSVESRDKNLLPEFFRTSSWFAGAENEAFELYVEGLERKASIKQVDYFSAEDIFIIGGNDMLHKWWNQTDMAPKILGEGKWLDVFAPEAQIGIHEFDDGNFGLGFKPQVRTADPESGDIYTADMTGDGGPEGTSESIGIVPIADLDEAMNIYKRENEGLAGINPAFARLPIYGEQSGGSPVFNRGASRVDTLSALADDPQAAVAAGRERETVLQDVLNELPDIVREKKKQRDAELAAVRDAEIEKAAAAAEIVRRDTERGYPTDLEASAGGLTDKTGNPAVRGSAELKALLPTFERSKAFNDAIKGGVIGPDTMVPSTLELTNVEQWKGYIRKPTEIPFKMNFDQWNEDLNETERLEYLATADEITRRSLEIGIQNAIGRGPAKDEKRRLIGHKIGFVGVNPTSLLGAKRAAVVKKSTIQEAGDMRAVIAFYKGEGNLTKGSKLRDYFKVNPDQFKDFKEDPHAFAMEYKDNMEGLYGPEVTEEVKEEILDPFLEATEDVDLDKFRTAVMNYTLGVDAKNSLDTINNMMAQAGRVTVDAEQALTEHLLDIEGNAFNWGHKYREAITLQALQSIPIDDKRWKSMTDGLAMWIDSGNWTEAQMHSREQLRLSLKETRDFQFKERDFQFKVRQQNWQESNDLIKQISEATDLTKGGQDFVSSLTSPDLPRSGAINGMRGSPKYLRSMLDVMSDDLRKLATWRGTLIAAKERGIWGVRQENDYQRWAMETGVRFVEIMNAMQGANRNLWQRFVAFLPFTPSGMPGHRTFDTMPSLVALDINSKPTDNIDAVVSFQVMKADGVTLAGAGAKVSVYGNINEELGAEGLQILMGWAEFGNKKYRAAKGLK